MELRQIRYFVKATETLNFTEAARLLYISQSTLSQQIKQLENSLETPLFNRIGRHILLTEAGSLFLPQARRILIEAEGGKQLITNLKGIQTGELSIGVTYGMSELFREALIKFSTQHEKVKIHVEYGTSEELMEKLNQVKLDLVLSFIQHIPEGNINSELLFQIPLVLVVHKDHYLATKKIVRLEELKNIPLVLPSLGFITRKLMEKMFHDHKIKPPIEIELNDINSLLQLVTTGKWSTILTPVSIRGINILKAVPVSEFKMEIQASISWNAHVYRKKAGILFQKIIRQLTLDKKK